MKLRTMRKPTERLVSTSHRMNKKLIIEKLGSVMAVCLVYLVNIISNASLFVKVLKVSKEFYFTVWALKLGHLEEDCPIIKSFFLKTKDSQVFLTNESRSFINLRAVS